jgi:gamma-glutamylcyclotransferase (GGCT)/AIG2-like uncharacterized protein YtfP
MALVFLNGGGMRGGPLHHHLQGAPLIRAARTAPRYRFWAAGPGNFPAMQPVDEGGCSVAGEVYDVPLEVLMRHLLPAEPPELELGIVELDDGTACLAMVLRQRFGGADGLVDISDIGDWRAYLAQRR